MLERAWSEIRVKTALSRGPVLGDCYHQQSHRGFMGKPDPSLGIPRPCPSVHSSSKILSSCADSVGADDTSRKAGEGLYYEEPSGERRSHWGSRRTCQRPCFKIVSQEKTRNWPGQQTGAKP